ncbi:MAG: hypothetical protein HFF60_04335 [Oscillospiraceae bacterium]|nr:hypothetical protein [Oscillospiraceae bacterium]
MKRNFHLTALLLSLALFCAACGARIPGGEEKPAGEDQTAPVIVTAPDQTGSFEPAPSVPDPVQLPEEPDAVDGGVDEPENPVQAVQPLPLPESTEELDAEPRASEETSDLSGWYRDLQGTDVIYSELILSRQEEGNGLYDASIGLYRLTTLEGIAQVQEDGTLLFVGGPPKVQAVITIDGEQAKVEFTVSEFMYIQPGDVFTFPDGKA